MLFWGDVNVFFPCNIASHLRSKQHKGMNHIEPYRHSQPQLTHGFTAAAAK